MTPRFFRGRRSTCRPSCSRAPPPPPRPMSTALGCCCFSCSRVRCRSRVRRIAALRSAHGRGARKRLRDLRSDVPQAIVQVIECATEPDPAKRYQTVGDLEHALAAASGAPVALAPAEPVQPASRLPPPAAKVGHTGRTMLWAAAGVLLAAALAVDVMRYRPSAAPVTARFTVGPPYTTGSWPRLSPDGRLIVFGTGVEGRNRLWIRPLDSLDGRPLMNTTATETPFWSPDSRMIAFFADGKLKKIPADGGEPETITDALQPHGGRLDRRSGHLRRAGRHLHRRARRKSADDSHDRRRVGWRLPARVAEIPAGRPAFPLHHPQLTRRADGPLSGIDRRRSARTADARLLPGHVQRRAPVLRA